MDVRESPVLLAPRVSPVHTELLEVLDWLDLVVCLVREVVLALLAPLVLVVLMAMLAPPALLVPSVLLVPQVSPVAPAPRERLDPLELLAHLELREQEESPVPMELLAPLVPLETPVLMA